MFTRRGLFAFFGLAAASPGLAATIPTSWSVHDTLKARLDPEDYDAWFSRMEIEGPVQDPLLLTFPSKFQTRWVDHYYYDELLGGSSNSVPDYHAHTVRTEENENRIYYAEPCPALVTKLTTRPSAIQVSRPL